LRGFIAVGTLKTMAKKKRRIPAERLAEYARNMRLLEERIAYHRQKAAEERAAAEQPPQT